MKRANTTSVIRVASLTQPQAAEVLTHLAFYTGWPSVFSALPGAKDLFEKRPR